MEIYGGPGRVSGAQAANAQTWMFELAFQVKHDSATPKANRRHDAGPAKDESLELKI